MTRWPTFSIARHAAAAGVLLAALLVAAAISAGPLAPAAVPLSPDGTMHISAGDRCPVCAMRPARYPKSACAIQLTDGRTFYFCETGCLLRSWLHPDVHLAVGKSAIGRVIVREYFTGAHLDGAGAIWVAGSDVIGPMGPMIVTLDGEEHLAAFQRRHGGRLVFQLTEVTDALWSEMLGHRP